MSLRDDLIRDEGIRYSAYEDSEGYTTIGVGRMIDDRLGGGLSHEEVMYLLDNDIARVEAELDLAFPWWNQLGEGQRRGLANMAFQLGLSRLRGFKKMLAALGSGHYEHAAKEALNSKWARQTPKRAKRVAELLRGK